MDIGFIGLGVMGVRMATHLAHAGHRLSLLDANESVALDLAARLPFEPRVPMRDHEASDSAPRTDWWLVENGSEAANVGRPENDSSLRRTVLKHVIAEVRTIYHERVAKLLKLERQAADLLVIVNRQRRPKVPVVQGDRPAGAKPRAPRTNPVNRLLNFGRESL